MPRTKRAKPQRPHSITELRQEAEAAVDRLINLLDRINPYNDGREHQIDNEPCDDLKEEPSLGSIESHPDGYLTGAENPRLARSIPLLV